MSVRRSSVVVVVLGLGLLGVGWWLGEGVSGSRVVLGSGSVWFGSPEGVVALVDGGSGRRVALESVGEGVGSGVVVQAGSSAVVVDGEGGVLVGVDGASRSVGDPVVVDGGVDHAVSGGSSVWVVSNGGALVSEWGVGPGGVVSRVAGGELLGAPVGLVENGSVVDGSLVVDREGVLWALGSGGELRSYAGGVVRTRGEFGGVGGVLGAD